MDTNFAARILALPESVRAALATVEGPGWLILPPWTVGVGSSFSLTNQPPGLGAFVGSAWWPANPSRAVAVVLGCPLFIAYQRVSAWLPTSGGDDHAVALKIIEDRAGRGMTAAEFAATFADPAPTQTVTNLGKVGEVVNLQGPVTLSIGADGVKVVR